MVVSKELVVLGFFNEQGELVAFAVKNGKPELFSCKPLLYSGLADLFNADKLV